MGAIESQAFHAHLSEIILARWIVPPFCGQILGDKKRILGNSEVVMNGENVGIRNLFKCLFPKKGIFADIGSKYFV
jgi:hypothetical protein